MNLQPSRTHVTTALLQQPEPHRRIYRRTIRRMIGTPSKIETDLYVLPLTESAEHELEGFRRACHDFGYTVVEATTEPGSRMLRAWAPRLSAWFVAPISLDDWTRAERCAAEWEALGYRVEWFVTDERVSLRAHRQLEGARDVVAS